MPPPPVAIFDLDGTLTDSKPGILRCLTATLTARGIPWSEPLDWFIGPPPNVSMPRLMPYAKDAERDAIVAEYRALYAESGWAQNSVYPGVPDLLAQLQGRGWRLFVCTSKRADFALKILDRFGLSPFFEKVYADAPVPQPGALPHTKSALLGELLDEQQLRRSPCYMIGDRSFDVEAARTQDIVSVAVTYGYGSEAELAAARPDFLCHSTAEVASLLAQHAAGQR